MSDRRIELLQNMPVFGGVKGETLEFILELAGERHVARGEDFFRRDDEAVSFFVLESGHVDVLREYEGQDYILSDLGPGDCFGEMAFIEIRTRNATVRATQDCVAVEVPLDALSKLYERDIEQYVLIQMNLAREISRRLREADRRLFEGMVAARDNGGEYWWYLD